MTPASRYNAVCELVELMFKEERPADGILAAYFRGARYMGSSDRKSVRERFYRILRHYHRLTWHIERHHYTPSYRSYVFLDSMFQGEHKPKDMAMRIFTGEDYAPKRLSDAEMKLMVLVHGTTLDHKDMPPRIRYECPEWAWGKFVSAFGEEGAVKQLEAMQVKNDVHLRVNTLKSDVDTVFDKLTKDGLAIERGAFSPMCIRVKGHPPMTQNDLYKSGDIEIQNEGSQLIALATAAKSGERVVDFCAGAGGKTLAIAAMMDNKGQIVASDVLEGRLKRSKQRFRRAGVHNIETRPLSSERDKWVKRQKGKYDVVLVDAPCSGVGTWRGDPDKRIRQLGPGLSELVPLQAEILDSAQRLVKPGGRLIYATCSLLPEENETQIEQFLHAHPDFERGPLPDTIPTAVQSDGFMKATPADHDCDGFFAAVMVRKPE